MLYLEPCVSQCSLYVFIEVASCYHSGLDEFLFFFLVDDVDAVYGATLCCFEVVPDLVQVFDVGFSVFLVVPDEVCYGSVLLPFFGLCRYACEGSDALVFVVDDFVSFI